jgi:hypothetical protein
MLPRFSCRDLVARPSKETWRAFCSSINDLPKTARLNRALSKDPKVRLGSLVAPSGGRTQSEGENLDLLLHTHFTDSEADEGEVASVFAGRATRLDWQVATKVVTCRRVVWAIDSFAPYESPGMDGIFPALLQEGWEVLVPYLVRIFCTCMAISYFPTTWRQVKVLFIPKPGRDYYGGPKDYRPISLTLFLLKTMERQIDFYGMKFWYLYLCIPINMHTRLENLLRRPFINLWFGMRRFLISRKQLWLSSLI